MISTIAEWQTVINNLDQMIWLIRFMKIPFQRNLWTDRSMAPKNKRMCRTNWGLFANCFFDWAFGLKVKCIYAKSWKKYTAIECEQFAQCSTIEIGDDFDLAILFPNLQINWDSTPLRLVCLRECLLKNNCFYLRF